MGAIKLYPGDTVAIATCEHKKGDVVTVNGESIELLSDVPLAHKIALKDFKAGDEIRKYDNVCGYASCDIKKGEWIHTHNDKSGLGKERKYQYDFNPISVFPGTSDKTFMGYERENGEVGIRNHILVFSTVFCANGPMRKIAEMAKIKYPPTTNFDGIVGLEQTYGCSQFGKDKENAMKISAGIAMNANFGGVLFIGNGCETNPPVEITSLLHGISPDRIKSVTCQEVEDEFEEGMKAIDELYSIVIKDKRTEVNIGRLHIATNCGGSDGLSGITANTVLGSFSDRIVKEGATISMTEVPEMMGAEHVLMNRAADEKRFEDVVGMMDRYYRYLDKHGFSDIGTLITQGNMAGGLTTLEEKSLGCIHKAGHTAVTEVLGYAERATQKGLVLMTGPGNDLAGVSNQIAAGAVLVLFTTGRGTPAGFAGPLFRISSNTELATRKPHWIDFDAGRLLRTESQEEVEALYDELYDAVMETINGNYHTCTEKMGYYMQGHFKTGLLA